jgi:hypothetical protein
MAKVITTGSVYTEDQAVAWLVEHGASTSDCDGMTMITLPDDAQIGRGPHDGEHTVGFDGAEHYVEVELDVDAAETVLRLK